jgi:CheY-like chemotaxis protein
MRGTKEIQDTSEFRRGILFWCRASQFLVIYPDNAVDKAVQTKVNDDFGTNAVFEATGPKKASPSGRFRARRHPWTTGMKKEEKRPVILVVDDVPANVRNLESILAPIYSVKVAYDGAAALQVAEGRDRCDMILLDVGLPDTSGFEICRRLKAEPRTKAIPILFLTDDDEHFGEEQGFEAGGVDYIRKPVFEKVILARVKTHLSLSQARHELEKQNALLRENAVLQSEIERMTRHDLKGFLSAIINVPNMLIKAGDLPPDKIDLLEMVEKAGYRMMHIINRSVDLIKMERGEYELHPVPVDVVKTVFRVLQEQSELSAPKHLTIHVQVRKFPAKEQDTMLVFGEENLFAAMFSSLIKNAFEASPEGDPVSLFLDDRERFTFEICNRGAIPSEIRPRFFARHGTVGKKKRPGLGAYSVYLMAKVLGGAASFETSEDFGTSVRLEIPEKKREFGPAEPLPFEPRPLHKPSLRKTVPFSTVDQLFVNPPMTQGSPGPAESVDPVPATNPAPIIRLPTTRRISPIALLPQGTMPGSVSGFRTRSQKRILLVEDHVFMRKIIMEILRQAGFFHFIEASDGCEARACLENDPVDLIISDWNMPECSGIDLLREVRARPAWKAIPFIMVTARNQDAELKKIMEIGTGAAVATATAPSPTGFLVDFVTKPFSGDVLRAKVEAFIG